MGSGNGLNEAAIGHAAAEASDAGQPLGADPVSPSAEEYLAQHPITLALKQSGVTDEHLEAVRFSSTEGLEFEQWACMPLTCLQHPHLIRAYCTLKWLILADPPASRARDHAWDYVARVMAEPVFAMGLKTSENQRKRAQKGRGKVTDERSIKDVIRSIVLKPEYRELSARELWPHLYAELDDMSLDPQAIEHSSDPPKNRYVYLNERGSKRSITFGRFSTIVSEVRRSRPN